MSDDGGVMSPVPPGYERDVGAVNAFAWRAVVGCEMRVDMLRDVVVCVLLVMVTGDEQPNVSPGV